MSGPGLPPRERLAGVLFDFDGTLADTADDLAAPIQAIRAERGLAPMDIALLRPWASMGARGLIQQGLGVRYEDAGFPALRERFLSLYEAALVRHTHLFDGMADVLAQLERAGIPWGIVSNKIERYLMPIVETMGLAARAAVVVGGDTTPHAKPHAAPLQHAARVIGAAPRDCVYVGDDLRDIAAGKAAGMATVAALYGYCGVDAPPAEWGADASIDAPLALPGLLGLR